MDDEISIFHLILESRQLTLSLLNGMKFWTCCLIFIAVLQLLSVLLNLPIYLDAGQALFVSAVAVPAIVLSFLGVRTDTNVMNISTGKNAVLMNGDAARYVAWCYGSRFVPAAVMLIVCHVLSLLSGGDGEAVRAASGCLDDGNATTVADSTVDLCDNLTSLSVEDALGGGAVEKERVRMLRLANFGFLHLYLVILHCSYDYAHHKQSSQIIQFAKIVPSVFYVIFFLLI